MFERGDVMMWRDGMGMGLRGLWLVLVIIGVVVLVFALVKLLARDRQPGAAVGDARPRRAREILEERYARGEIGTEEFRERLRTLEEPHP